MQELFGKVISSVDKSSGVAWLVHLPTPPLFTLFAPPPPSSSIAMGRGQHLKLYAYLHIQPETYVALSQLGTNCSALELVFPVTE